MARTKDKSIAKKTKSTAITKWDEELAKFAQEAADTEATPGGSFISVRGGQISVAGQPVAGNKLHIVILDNVFENALYEGKYDPDDPQPPTCFAFARDEDELKPHEKVAKPKFEQCKGCEFNEYGSADTGRGKACKNVRRLAVISADGLSAESIRDGEVLYFKVPVTSVKGWAYYVKGLAATLKRPPFAVVTELGVVPDPKTQFKITFRTDGPVPDALLGAIMERRAEVMETTMFPYSPASEREEEPKGNRRNRRSRKF